MTSPLLEFVPALVLICLLAPTLAWALAWLMERAIVQVTRRPAPPPLLPPRPHVHPGPRLPGHHPPRRVPAAARYRVSTRR